MTPVHALRAGGCSASDLEAEMAQGSHRGRDGGRFRDRAVHHHLEPLFEWDQSSLDVLVLVQFGRANFLASGSQEAVEAGGRAASVHPAEAQVDHSLGHVAGFFTQFATHHLFGRFVELRSSRRQLVVDGVTPLLELGLHQHLPVASDGETDRPVALGELDVVFNLVGLRVEELLDDELLAELSGQRHIFADLFPGFDCHCALQCA